MKLNIAKIWNWETIAVIASLFWTWTCLTNGLKIKDEAKNIDLRCDFKKLMQNNISEYTCAVLFRKVLLKDQVTMSGKHFWMCDDKNVTFLAFYGSTVKRIPNIIFQKFPLLEKLDVQITKMEVLDEKALKGAYSLKEIWAKSNVLERLEADSFNGATNLELISLSSNTLNFLDENTFKKLRKLEKLFLAKNYIVTLHRDIFMNSPNLKLLKLHSDKIQELPEGLFRNNLKLEDVSLNNNKIKIIGDNLFKSLLKLKHINLSWNVCISHSFSDGFTSLSLLNEETEKCTEENTMEGRIQELTSELYELRRIITKRYTNDN